MEKEILAYIKRYMKATGFTPTYREIAAVMGLKSVSSVSNYMMKLEDAGLIEFSEGRKQYKPVGAEWRFDEDNT